MSEGRQKSLLPSAQTVAAWKAERDRLAAQAREIEAQREAIQKMIEGAEALAPSQPALPDTDPIQKIRTTRVAASRRKKRAESWTGVIEEIVGRADRGITYDALKQEVRNTSYGPKLAQSDKGFYGAISKLLVIQKKVVKHKGHLFTPAKYKRFADDLAAGRVPDIAAPPGGGNHQSPFGDAIRAFMRTRAGVGAESGDISDELRKDPHLADTMSRNKTHLYNVLARLVEKGDLTKGGGRYYPSPKLQTATSLKLAAE